LKNLTNKRLIVISLVAWVLNTYIFISLLEDNAPMNFAKFFPLLHVATFIVGVCSGILFVRNYHWLFGKGKQLILAITAVVGLIVLYTAYKDFDIYNYQHNGLLAPLFVFVIYSLAIMKGKFIDILASRPFVFLGSISYSIYILQYPVLQICQKYLPLLKGRETGDIFYPYFIVLVFCSIITYLFIEKPARIFLTRRKKHIDI
jgi:peptidoglycan/LPS O-acetylase OafA/YrhL